MENSNNFNNKQSTTDPVTVVPQPTNAVLIEPIGQEPIVEPIPTAPVGPEPIVEPIPNAPVRPEPQPIDQIPNEPIKPEPQPIPPTVTTEPFIVEPNTPNNSPEEINMQTPEQEKATLRDKFNIHDNQDFEKLLAYYAHLNKSYYTAEGQVHSQEEMRRRKNINAQLKRILANKAKEMSQNENGENFSSTLIKIEKGELFSHNQLKEIAENKVACLKLFEIMARGVYEKDGQKIRLTQKQRIALASTLELVSEFRLDKMNAKLNANSQNAEISNESVLGE